MPERLPAQPRTRLPGQGRVRHRRGGRRLRGHRVYVAAVEGRIVGGVRLEATDPDRAKVSRLGVRDGWKGEGVGSRPLDRAEQAARDCGYGTLWLTTPGDHPFLPDFYRRRGYEETGPCPPENDELVMEKSLQNAECHHAQVALRWLVDRPAFRCISIVGTRTVDRLEGNLGVFVVSLSDDQFERIRTAYE